MQKENIYRATNTYLHTYVNILHQWHKENSKEGQLSKECQCVIQYNGNTLA